MKSLPSPTQSYNQHAAGDPTMPSHHNDTMTSLQEQLNATKSSILQNLRTKDTIDSRSSQILILPTQKIVSSSTERSEGIYNSLMTSSRNLVTPTTSSELPMETVMVTTHTVLLSNQLLSTAPSKIDLRTSANEMAVPTVSIATSTTTGHMTSVTPPVPTSNPITFPGLYLIEILLPPVVLGSLLFLLCPIVWWVCRCRCGDGVRTTRRHKGYKYKPVDTQTN